MIDAKRDARVTLIAWVIGGSVMSILALFTIMGGLKLAILMAVAVPLVLVLLVVETTLRSRQVHITHRKAQEERTALAPGKIAPSSVSARVVHVDGTCPQGYRFDVGDTLSIGESVRGAHPVCPGMEQLLRAASTRLKEGSPSGEEVRCLGKSHRIILALQSPQSAPIPSPAWRSYSGREK